LDNEHLPIRLLFFIFALWLLYLTFKVVDVFKVCKNTVGTLDWATYLMWAIIFTLAIILILFLKKIIESVFGKK